MSVLKPTKSILKQINSPGNTSWFSKFNEPSNNNNNTNTSPPRINNLFNGFRKPQVDHEEVTMATDLNPKELKRVRFPVSGIKKEFLFLKDDPIVETKKQIEIEPINIQTLAQLLSLYELVCRNKQAQTIDLLVSAMITQPQATYLTRIDLTNQLIDRYNIEPLADIMSAIKVLMHSLLENDKISELSLVNNPKLTTNGFKYIAVYIRGSSQLAKLDLSYTQPDKKSIQYIINATIKNEIDHNSPSLAKLLLNGCVLRNQHMEVLASGIKKSCIKHLYLRGNKFINGGALSIGVMLRDYEDSVQSLIGLYLDNNDLSQGIEYITQALRRNQSLLTLSMCDCKIDSKGCVLVGEALKYNQHLEIFDMGYNPLCSSNMDGINQIRQALNINRSLKDLRLTDTDIGTEAAIALAECLPENNSLVRLDLSRNPQIKIAGLMAISVSIRMNHTITFIDINIPTDDNEMVEIHNGILATCTRNAQSKKQEPQQLPNHVITTAQATARLTLQERLAAVTKGRGNTPTLEASSSEVTLTQMPLETKPQQAVVDDSVLIQQAFDCVESLEDVLNNKNNNSNDTINNCKKIQSDICSRIPVITDQPQLEILLAVNDRLTSAIQTFEKADVGTVEKDNETEQELSSSFEIGDADDRAQETLSSSFEIGDDDDEDEEEERDHLKELRSEIEAEESAAFLKAKQVEHEELAVVVEQ
ncbi:hypothetical protein INT48_004937 [Thamnidium elegans]|uniref:Uncharacterized protein n=1 Tax=Thamnidium elegans TaxID=101142 RepID=A0A8H7SJK5_9FUNG|nr:hypothetical protein INT48_004937 [Thamnidium elegans]